MARHYQLRQTEPIDPSLCYMMYRWAAGSSLDSALNEAELLVGDFIRWCKQVIDLLSQIAQSSSPVAGTAREAIDKVKRGIVAYSYYV